MTAIARATICSETPLKVWTWMAVTHKLMLKSC